MTKICCCKRDSEAIVEYEPVEWMKNLPVDLHEESITRLAIPGTHDSFAFKLTRHPGPDLHGSLRRVNLLISPIIKKWSITQNLTFAGAVLLGCISKKRSFFRVEQLQIGIRYFDFRVCRTIHAAVAKRSAFTFTHGLRGGLVRDGLEEINEFLTRHSQEIALLDFIHFYDFNEEYDHEQLIELIEEIFGEKICTTVEKLSDCTLNYLWRNKQQVILLYNRNRDRCSIYRNRIGHFFQVCQSPWPNTSNIARLFDFLNEQISSARSTTCINVIQGQITPDSTTVRNNPFRSLRTFARETNRRLIDWLYARQRDPSFINGVNVVICDFADQRFTTAVIELNYQARNSSSV